MKTAALAPKTHNIFFLTETPYLVSKQISCITAKKKNNLSSNSMISPQVLGKSLLATTAPATFVAEGRQPGLCCHPQKPPMTVPSVPVEKEVTSLLDL